jgi:hypothetical protein
LPLAAVAYFCLTVLKDRAGSLKQIPAAFAVDGAVVQALGKLSSTKGGKEARKAAGRTSAFTGAERQWLEQVVPLLIRRVGEVDAGTAQALTPISMADLPTL